MIPDQPHGFIHDLDETEYHTHKGSLSVTGAKTLLRAPAKYLWQLHNPVHKDVFDVGSAAHKMVLGVGAEIVVVDADSWRTKAAREEQAAARAEGKIPLLTEDHQRVLNMADTLSSHRLAMRLLSDGAPEVSAFCTDEPTGVLRRARFDWLGSAVLTDYKSAASSEPEEFVKAAVRFGYHMQAAWYLDIAADLDHPASAFAFIAQEKEPPYLVTAIELPPELVDVGRARNARARERFRDCTDAGRWPGYIPDDEFATPSAPRWALTEETA